MKMLKFAALGFAVLLWTSAAVAQHGHPGGGMGMGGPGGSSMGADHSGGISSMHGNPNSVNSGSSHQATIDQVLSKNPAIGDKITALTGASSASNACQGFKNLGQCVAAAHVAKNLPNGNFYCLRQAMTGVAAPNGTTCTTTGSMSLGKAIQTLYPQANPKTESKKANAETKQDLKGSGVKS